MVTRITDLRTQGDYTSLDDRMLVLDFQAGQPEAFVEIHRRYGQLARHVCQRFLPNRADSDEAFQETMIRVYQGLHRFNGQYALQPWVARIATNVSLDQIRTRARRPQVDDGALDEHDHRDPSFGPDEMLERLIERDLVLSVLGGLPPSHRTALVLRELEGRSHKEIAEALNISPAQAKALIHRAKMSFRKNWLIAVTEKGGLAGIAILPLMLVVKVLDGARKVVDRIGGHAVQVVQVATPEVVSTAASSPTTVNLASSMTERVVAAGMTILLAGGVTVGAATIVKHRADHPQARGVVAAPAPSPSASAAASPSPTTVGPAEREPRVRPTKEPHDDQTVVVPPVGEPETSPTETPSTSPTESPSPSESPTPDPSPTTPPGPPPAPAWAFGLTYLGPSFEPCGCGADAALESSSLEGAVPGEVTMSQSVKGVVHDISGRALWPFYLEFDGTASGSDGSLSYKLVISPDGASPYWYEGEAFLTNATRGEHGSMAYSFLGGYQLRPDQEAVGVPAQGRLTATLGVWPDGTIYLGSFTLLEATP